LTTLVVSDLHLGARTRIDLLRRAELREPLLRAVEGADEVVLLGDVLELRHGPAREALDAARAFFEELGEAVGDGRVLIVPGNHDHELVAPWLERRRREDPGARLGLQETATPAQASDLARTLGERLGRATLELSYPGVWVADGVYATHGHYLDRHTTVPTYERLGAALVDRFVRPVPDPLSSADDYEAILAPMYALLFSAAQYVPVEAGAAHNGLSLRVWQGLGGAGGARRSIGYALVAAGLPAGVAALNRAGLGPLSPELTGTALRAASLEAMGEVIRRLGVDAEHVIFGHSHRAGPFARDRDGDWTSAEGVRFLNTGSWTYEPAFLSPTPNESPYWPGTCVVVEEEGPPQLKRLLGYRTHEDLRDPALPA
jgi:predicted phosphodiesterase